MFASSAKVVLQLEASRKRNSHLSPTLVVARTGSRLRATSSTKEPALSKSPKSVGALLPCYRKGRENTDP